MENKLKVITEKEGWNNFISKMDSFDCYHTYDYHLIDKRPGEEAVLLTYEEVGVRIGLPLIIRSIDGTTYKDATSVYGYTGPLSNKLPANFDNSKFLDLLLNWFKDQSIISIFSRLNPFIPNQEEILAGLGNLRELGKIVNIDLTQNIDEQRTQFSKTTKRYLNKVRRSCYVEISQNKADLDSFIDLYYENMKRVNATDTYFFDHEYFKNLLNCTDFDTDLILARLTDTDEIISAALMFKTNNIIQYHLSGTKNKYLDLTPIRLLIDETRIRGTEKGYEFFNLGGGLGSKDDSLFFFKSSFSKDFRFFKTWNCIINQPVYDRLCNKNSNLDSTTEEQPDFFPLYRFKAPKG